MSAKRLLLAVLFACTLVGGLTSAEAKSCEACHQELNPGVVADWQASQHGQKGIKCSACHGTKHRTDKDIAEVTMPTPEVCATCHPDRVAQYKAGKHAKAWVAMKAMPTTHWKPMELIDGMKGCGGCHKIGMKTETEVRALLKDGGGGVAACDACHTRHLFSAVEARQPQACQTCHMGFDHPQWEMYSGSKHGVRALLKQIGVLPESVSAPTCQTCHMADGDHEVRTAWGFLAVRLPLPEDPEWRADQTTILQALGVLDPDGKPTSRLDVVKAADVARLTQEAFDREREKMVKICTQCHSERFGRAEMEKGDRLIQQVDHLMATAIREVAALYAEGVLQKPENYAYPFPDLLMFHDAPTPIENRLYVMFLKHRMRAFQGAFHNNPDYALWYGWSEMRTDLTEITHMAKELRRIAQSG
jgi:hypothetical protein